MEIIPRKGDPRELKTKHFLFIVGYENRGGGGGGGGNELLMAVSLLNYIAYMINITSWGLKS